MITPALIRLNGIGVRFQGRPILTDIDLAVQPGEIVTLIGPNGAGKTTLIRVVLGLQTPSAGERLMQAGVRIGYMPQKLHIDDHMPITVKRFLAIAGGHRRVSRQDITHRIHAVLARTGVQAVSEAPVQSLSGGELQRVLLARALLNNPHLLVLDEPVQGIDVNGQRAFYRLITALKQEQGCAVLMVSHDLHLVMAATHQVVCINRHVCCSGHPQQVQQHPAYRQLFGGASAELAVYTHHHDHEHGLDGRVVTRSQDTP